MSRQYDEAMEGRFDLYGTEYSLILPSNLEELMEALEVKEALVTHISGLMHDEDSSGYESLLQEQEDYISEYIESLGEFDNSQLIANINYFLKKLGLRMGELEQMIGLSAGYISRTAKENSAKKLSIDVVWKLAQLFETDINELIDSDLEMPNSNTDILVRFVDKLNSQTLEKKITWALHGGFMAELDKRYVDMGLISENPDESFYHPADHLNQELEWVLSADIVALERFDKNRDLVLIPYSRKNKDVLDGCDFLFVWHEVDGYHWEKVFYTSDDPFGKLKDHTSVLLDTIQDTEFDAQVTPEIRSIISNYLK